MAVAYWLKFGHYFGNRVDDTDRSVVGDGLWVIFLGRRVIVAFLIGLKEGPPPLKIIRTSSMRSILTISHND